MSGAEYLSKPAKRELPIFRKLVPLVAAALAILVAFVSLGAGALLKPQQAEAGPIEWVVCEWAGEDSIAHFAYEAAFTDNIAYMFNSKSAISGGTDDVSGSFLNVLLGLTHDFTKVNEEIMGVGLKATSDYEGKVNGGVKVNPYDRFGVAGMYWSSYGGEWNYLKVDVCGSGSEPVNMRIGAYYDDRLAPLSTFGGISQSTDVRSLAAAQKSLVVANDWVNIVANGIFNITKFVVVVTSALIGVAFSDIVGFLGLSDLIGSDNGLFTKFYTGVYLPLIGLVMLLMAVWAFWHGIVKRSYRRTLAGIAQSIFLFVMAAVVAFNPLFFISLPNNIAIVGQSLIVNTLSSSLYAGNGLCTVGGVYTVNSEGKQVLATPNGNGQVNTSAGTASSVTNVEENRSLLEQASQSMQSVIGCQLWYTYVLRPWSMGQFGTDVNNLWAKGHSDSVAGEPKELNNDNEAWVGDAAVPLGGGYTLNNWAIFQISTQTNAHVPLKQEEPARSVYTDGVANDWWRIVDAVSNYNETTQSNGIPSGCTGNATDASIVDGAGHCVAYNPSQTTPVDSKIPDTSKKPTDYWQNWIGAKPGDRMTAALGSVVPAIIGNLAPLVFAGMSAIFAIMLAIAMAVAPLFLLLGSWPGNGWNMFKSWGQLVLNLMMKRIVAGILLVLSLILISMVLQLTSGNPFIGFIVLVVVSLGLFKFRNQIFDRLAGIFTFNFANSNLGATGMQAWSKFSNATKQGAEFAGRAGVAAATGGEMARRSGKSVWSGVAAGAKQELRTSIYRSPTWAMAFNEAEALKGETEADKVSGDEICAYCSAPLRRSRYSGEAIFNGGIDQEGNYVCEECMDNPKGTISGIDPYEHGARRVRRQFINEDSGQFRGLHAREEMGHRLNRDGRAAVITESVIEDDLDNLEENFIDEKTGEVAKNFPDLVAKMFAREAENADDFRVSPTVPKQLEPYMPETVKNTLPHLWKDPNPQAREVVIYAYAQAMNEYAYARGAQVGYLTGDVRNGSKADIQVLIGSIVTEITNNENERNRNDDNPTD